MLVRIATYDIADGTLAGGVAIGQLRYQVDRQIEIVVPLDEIDPDTLDRGGRKTTVGFIVQRVHDNAGAAEEFIVSLDTELPSFGDVELEFTETSAIWTIPNAKVVSHNSEQLGATTTTSYTIIGGKGVEGSGSGPTPPPPPPGAMYRFVNVEGPPGGVTLQVKNSSDVWEDIFTYTAST